MKKITHGPASPLFFLPQIVFGKKIKITGILYLHRINDKPYDATSSPSLSYIPKIMWERISCSSAIGNTMWEKLSNQDDGERRMVILRGHWSDMINKGSQSFVMTGRRRAHGTWLGLWWITKTSIQKQTQTLTQCTPHRKSVFM